MWLRIESYCKLNNTFKQYAVEMHGTQNKNFTYSWRHQMQQNRKWRKHYSHTLASFCLIISKIGKFTEKKGKEIENLIKALPINCIGNIFISVKYFVNNSRIAPRYSKK